MFLGRQTGAQVREATSFSMLEASEAALEVRVTWCGEPLRVDHLSPPRSYLLAADASADFRMDAELLPGGSVALPPVAGRFQYGELVFEVRDVPAARPVGRGPAPVDWAQHLWTLCSVGLHALLLLAFALVPPSASAVSLERLRVNDRYAAFIELQQSRLQEPPTWVSDGMSEGGAPGEAHEGESGAAGDPATANRRKRRRATHGEPSEVTSPPIAARDVRSAGILGVLRQVSTDGIPSSPYTALVAQGSDPTNALGALIGDHVGSSWGTGLGIIGTGRGGGGRAVGTLGVGLLGTKGGPCAGPDCGGAGFGTGPEIGFGRRPSKVPGPIRPGPVEVKGSLSKETIRRIVRRQLRRVRHCYEQGLHRRPDLSGRVSVKFLIAPSGIVRAAAISRTSLGDVRVEQCIAKVMRQLDFPAPGGVVSVTYPFTLAPVG